jgi:hypothetical protein
MILNFVLACGNLLRHQGTQQGTRSSLLQRHQLASSRHCALRRKTGSPPAGKVLEGLLCLAECHARQSLGLLTAIPVVILCWFCFASLHMKACVDACCCHRVYTNWDAYIATNQFISNSLLTRVWWRALADMYVLR